MYKMQDFGLLACRAQGLDLDLQFAARRVQH